MARKVFISFLGKGFYEETNYIDSSQNKGEVISTRFVQEASILNYTNNFSEKDKIIILTTEGSLKNWEDNEHYNYRKKENEFYEGLQTKLEKLNLFPEVKNIPIPEGESTQELWEIFQIVFDLIEDEDEIIFDITHGFRSLPMLNMVLINYAKLLKNISVRGIYYGAFEAKKKLIDGKEYSPLWDLKSFVELQDWTNAAQMFLKTGNGLPLSEMVENRRLKEELMQFSKFILVNRGVDIYKGNSIVALKKELHKILNSDISVHEKPLIPILKKVENEFIYYKQNDVLNGFLAVKWAIKNGLIQQGATMLEEAITTLVLYDLKEDDKIQNPDIRQSASAALVVKQPFRYRVIPKERDTDDERAKKARLKAKEILAWEKEFVPKIQKLSYKDELGRIVSNLKENIRNDINHAGFRKAPKNYNTLNKLLINYYQEIQNYLKSNNIITLPNLYS